MDIALVAFNARYNHTNLAVRYLKNSLRTAGFPADILEYSINEHDGDILPSLYRVGAKYYCFSCYIWNITKVLAVCRDLKKIMPHIKIILGGPEVSYNPNEIIEENPFVDFIMCGEGEKLIVDLFSHIEAKRFDFDAHICYAKKTGETKPYFQTSFEGIAFPYEKDELFSKDKIFYYETSRGCPNSCAYCLSSEKRGVIFKDLDEVKKELFYFIEARVPVVKLVDRTFNCDKRRALEIFKFLVKENKETMFHFEICADLLDEESFEVLKAAKPGTIRFESGIQSVKKETLCEINRKTDLLKVLNAVTVLKGMGNIELHLDLIAGLPQDTFQDVGEGINAAYFLCDMLQLGFLKLLRGTKLRKCAKDFSYRYSEAPPYEVFSNAFISYEEILRLKQIEEILSRYKNSGAFSSLDVLIKDYFVSPFEFLNAFADYLEKKAISLQNKSRKSQFEIIFEFIKESFGEQTGEFLELLAEDYLKDQKGDLPEYLRWEFEGDLKKLSALFFESTEGLLKYFPEYLGKRRSDILKENRIYPIKSSKKQIMLFNSKYGKIYNITEFLDKSTAKEESPL